MLGRSTGTTNEWGLNVRSGGGNNNLNVWKVIGDSNGHTTYQSFHTSNGQERLRITSGGEFLVGATSSTGARGIIQQNSSDTNPLDQGTCADSSGFRLQNYSFGVGRYTALSMECANSSTVQSASIIAQSVSSGQAPDIIIATRTSNSANKERARIHNYGGLHLRNIQPPYGSSEMASRHVYAFHRSGTYNNFYVEFTFETAGSYCIDLRLGGYNTRNMHFTYQGYLYAGNQYDAVGAIDSGNGPQRSVSNQGAYNTYGSIIRFGFSSMSSTHPVVHCDLSWGGAGGDNIAFISGMSWS